MKDTFQKIQRYLDQEMPPEERKAFETALKSDEQLAKEVALHRDMAELLSDSPENDLRKNLQLLNDQVKEDDSQPGNFLKHLLWLIPVIALISWWFLFPGKMNDLPNSENTATPQEEPAQNLPTTTPPVEEEDAATPQEEIKEPQPPQTPTQKPTQKKTKKTKQAPAPPTRPIAANFEPNPSIEFLIENNVRDNEYELDVLKKQENTQLKSTDEAVTFEFEATIKSTSNLLEQDFKLHLFSNDPTAFEDFQPLSTSDITLTKSADDTFDIDFQKEMRLAPGLYYYILEDFAAERIYYVNKFAVRAGRR